MNNARVAAAQLLAPPDAGPRPDTGPRTAPPRERAARIDREAGSPDVLAGMCAGVALRDINLVDSLLAQLEDMEADESDQMH